MNIDPTADSLQDRRSVLENEVGNVHTTDGEWIVVHKRGGRRQSGKTIGWKNGTE